jgi:hypothetical protein
MLAEEQASEERSRMSEERRNDLLTLASRLESEVKTVVETVTGSAAEHDTAKAIAEIRLEREHGSGLRRLGLRASRGYERYP